MPIQDFIISIFCYIDDELKRLNLSLRLRGFDPAFSDSEAITIEVVGSFLGIECQKFIWSYFRHYWSSLFPRLPCRTTFIRQIANLWRVKQLLQKRFAEVIGPDDIHIVDGFPIPVRPFKRARLGSCFKGEASFGRSPSKGFYFGFKGHILVTAAGVIKNFILTPANVEEHQVLENLSQGIRGMLLGDKGYLGEKQRKELLEEGIFLQTPLKKNMQDSRPLCFLQKIRKRRKIVESVISQLVCRWKATRVWARDQWHLISRLSSQILAHTLAILLNRIKGRSLLVFDGLIT